MSSTFLKSDLKNQISLLTKNHPFLPDRNWLDEDLDEKLNAIIPLLNIGHWHFDSLTLYMEWQGKAVPAIKMSTPDWLVHFVIVEKLENVLVKKLVKSTAYKLSGMDTLIEECRKARKDNGEFWILKTDIKSFFSSVQPASLLKALSVIQIEENIFKLLKNYLKAIEKTNQKLSLKDSKKFPYSSKLGMPIGAELNYILTSFHLLEMDQELNQTKEVMHYFRYIDDILIFTKTEAAANEILQSMKSSLENLSLTLNLAKTKIQNSHKEIVFLQEVI